MEINFNEEVVATIVAKAKLLIQNNLQEGDASITQEGGAPFTFHLAVGHPDALPVARAEAIMILDLPEDSEGRQIFVRA